MVRFCAAGTFFCATGGVFLCWGDGFRTAGGGIALRFPMLELFRAGVELVRRGWGFWRPGIAPSGVLFSRCDVMGAALCVNVCIWDQLLSDVCDGPVSYCSSAFELHITAYRCRTAPSML